MAVPKEMQPTAMPRNFQKRASLSTCVEINQCVGVDANAPWDPSALPQHFARSDHVITRPNTAKACPGTVIAANSIQIVVKLDDAKGFEAYPPEGGEDLILRDSYIGSLEFLVRCPPEIAWHCLGYWRCQYPVVTSIIDELGVH